MDKREHRDRNEVTEVYVRLQQDELGYPPKQWEQLKAEQIDREVFRIKSVPFYARGLAYEDEVHVTNSDEGYYPVIHSVFKRSGYSTMRLWINDESEKTTVSEYFIKHHCLLEVNGSLVAIAIPKHTFEEVSEYICGEKDRGRWDAEDGYLVIDEDSSTDKG